MSWLAIEDRVAIVTGGASGIGKAISIALSDCGVKVIVFDKNYQEQVKDNLEKSNNIFTYKLDITDSDEVRDTINSVYDRFGKIDILVNNAGVNFPMLLVDSEDENSLLEINQKKMDLIYEINQKAVVILSQAVGKIMVSQKTGTIINVSSESGLEGSEGQSIYAATKAAMNSYTRSWAKELGKFNVRVIGIAPGIIEETGLRTIEYEESLAYTRGKSVDELRKGYTSVTSIPLGRVGKLEEIADVVTFLASDRSSYIHGVTINIAGGKTRG